MVCFVYFKFSMLLKRMCLQVILQFFKKTWCSYLEADMKFMAEVWPVQSHYLMLPTDLRIHTTIIWLLVKVDAFLSYSILVFAYHSSLPPCTFQEHIFNLMKSDSYSRYLRSDMYKEFVGGAKKKVPLHFPFHFPSKSKGEGWNTRYATPHSNLQSYPCKCNGPSYQHNH